MYIDHVGINTNDMEATLQFYCGLLGMRLGNFCKSHHQVIVI